MLQLRVTFIVNSGFVQTSLNVNCFCSGPALICREGEGRLPLVLGKQREWVNARVTKRVWMCWRVGCRNGSSLFVVFCSVWRKREQVLQLGPLEQWECVCVCLSVPEIWPISSIPEFAISVKQCIISFLQLLLWASSNLSSVRLDV